MNNKKLLGSIMIILHLLVNILGCGLPALAQETGDPKPFITDVEPNNGPAKGGTRVIIFGGNFGDDLGNVRVFFQSQGSDDSEGVEQEVVDVSDTRIEITTTRWYGDTGDDKDKALIQDIRVEIGDNSAEAPGAFRYTLDELSNPVIRNFTPDGGGAAGGIRVTITGEDFFTRLEDTGEGNKLIEPEVWFGDAQAKNVSVSLTEIVVISPPHWGGGPVQVKVVNPDKSEAVSEREFFYKEPSATITRITPQTGPWLAENPIWVRITGGNLPDWNWEEGEIDVSNWNIPEDWEVTNIEVQAFIGDSELDDLTWESASSLLARAPTEGSLDEPLPVTLRVTSKIKVINDDGEEEELTLVEESVIEEAFTLVEHWDVPQILEVRNTNPKLAELGRTNEGPLAGSRYSKDEIYVIGYNFSDNMKIYFGDLEAEPVGAPQVGPPPGIDNGDNGGEDNGSPLPYWQKVILPPAEQAGPVTVRIVREEDTAEGFLPRAFIYRDTAMSLAELFPKQGPASGGQTVTITGANLDLAEAVYFGDALGQNLVVDEGGKILTVETPRYGATETPVNVRVEDPFGSVILEEAYTFMMDEFDLSVQAITPNWDVRSGGGIVFIESENPVNGPRVFFGDTEAEQIEIMHKDHVLPREKENFDWQSDDAPYVIRVVVPPGETGWTKVRITNQMDEEETLDFYYQSQPEISAVDPALASVRGGNIINVKGTDFLSEFNPDELFPVPEEAIDTLTIQVGDIEIDRDQWELTAEGLVFRIPVAEEGEYPEGQYPLTITNADGGQVVWEDAITFTWASSQPKIEGFVPDKGTFQGGTNITVTGQHFDNPRLYLGLQEATIDEHGFLTIRGKTPPYRGERKPDGVEVEVTVVNADGSAAIAEDKFTYCFPEPDLQIRIYSLFPDPVLAYNENRVTIKGAGFQPGLKVYIGHEEAEVSALRDEEGNELNPEDNSPGSTIEILTPRLPEGIYDVTVVNPDTTLARREQALTFRLRETRPVINQVIPDIGPLGGGTRVTITGEDFRPGAKIYFGSTLATDLEVVDSETIIAWTPPSTPGKRDVMVVNPDGAISVLEDGFEYLDIQDSIPRITRVVPAEGPVTGGTRIRIIGQDFYYGDDARIRVFIGFNEAYEDLEVRNINENNYGDEITVLTPPGKPGTYDIFVFNPDGASFLLENAFTYREIPVTPAITAVEPPMGPVSGGIPILVEGENFAPGMEVFFGNKAATEVVVESESQATAWLPPVQTPQRVDVLVINPDGGSALLKQGFEYVLPEDAPKIYVLDPDWGRTTGNTPVTITGAGFLPGATVFFGSSPAREVKYETSGRLAVLSPPGQAGAVDIIVVNPDGGADVLLEGFLYKDVEGPAITGVDPDQGDTAGGELVTITGSNFDPGVQVYFGGEPAAVEEESGTIMVVTTPSHDPGLVDIRVVNPDGTQAVATGAFRYVGPPLPPEEVSVFMVEDTAIGLTWQAVPGAIGYEVYGRRSSRDEMSFMGATPENYIYLTGLRPNTRYYFEIRAVNLQGASDFSTRRVSARTERSKAITSPSYPPEDIYQIVGDTARIVLQEVHFRRSSSYTLDVQGPAYSGVNRYFVFIPARELQREQDGKLLLKTRGVQMSIPLRALGTTSRSSVYGVIGLEMVQGPEKEILTNLAPGQGQGSLYRIDAYIQNNNTQTDVSRFRRDIQLTFASLSPDKKPAFYQYNPAADSWQERSLYWSKPLELAIAQIREPGLYLLKQK